MKILLFTTVILGVVFFGGCESENPVSTKEVSSIKSLQKNINIIPDPLVQPFYGAIQSSGTIISNPEISMLDISGNGSLTGFGYSKIFSHSKINLTTKTQIGTLEITTSKGGKITGTLNGSVQKEINNVLYFSGNYELTKGTGNLAGFTGNGNYSGYFNKINLSGKLVLDGKIYLPEIIRIDRNSE
ncbi:MAG: hypothetical protein WCE54_12100 [Ignavibacteriaceae bacterium]